MAKRTARTPMIPSEHAVALINGARSIRSLANKLEHLAMVKDVSAAVDGRFPVGAKFIQHKLNEITHVVNALHARFDV